MESQKECSSVNERFPSVTVECYDGRRIDISDLSPAAAIAKLHAEGVKPWDIRATVHRISRAELSWPR